MICQSCGSENVEGAKFCGRCGAAMQQVQYANTPYVNYSPGGMPMNQGMYSAGPVMNKKQFSKHPYLNNITKGIMSAAILMYATAAITFAVSVVLGGNVFAIIDVILIVGLGLGIQLAQSRACAVVTGIYSMINLIMTIVLLGKPGGWFVVVAGIFAIVYTFKFQRMWEEYQRTGIVLNENI